MRIEPADARSILTPTGGWLTGFTHSLNPYRGCAYGGAACGVYCYAPETRFSADRRDQWGSYLRPKLQAAEHYRAEAARVRRRGGALRIFMSSVTDPYVPQEARLGVTRAILEAMLAEPPDLLVLQTHTPGPRRDARVLAALQEKARLVVQITVETDLERVPGLPPHAASVAERLAALQQLRQAGLPTVAVAAPLLPLRDPERFVARLGAAADGVIFDHWLVGDGSPGGARTRRRRAHAERPLPDALAAAGLGEWNTIERFEEIVALARDRLGAARVGVSCEGFARAFNDPRWPR